VRADAGAAVTTSVDRTQLAPGDTIELTLQSDHGGSGQPDLKALEKDFEILRRASSNSLQIVNGSASSQRQVRLTLSPRRKGRIEVPRLEWEGEQSAVIELVVAAGNGSASQEHKPARSRMCSSPRRSTRCSRTFNRR
jgi:hypothetical protein